MSDIRKVEFEVLDYSTLQMAHAICKYYLKSNSKKELALIDLDELVKHIKAYVEAERLADIVAGRCE